MNRLKFICLLLLFTHVGYGQEPTPAPPQSDEKLPTQDEAPPTPKKVEVKRSAEDVEIQERLDGILDATGWFQEATVFVNEGVVFLTGSAQSEEKKKWAGDLARNTTDVSAVVNKMEVIHPPFWNFEPTIEALAEQWRDLVILLPFLFIAAVLIFCTWGVAKLAIKFFRSFYAKKVSSPLLQDLLARAMGFLVYLIGFYIIFRMLGLTTIALTILGGTGALGIILGIAFRDITENILASIFLSIHHPFQSGDLIEVEGVLGIVDRLTIRTTVITTIDGNEVQIPNSKIYTTVLRNYHVNPSFQTTFTLTIGYEDSIPEAQEVALQVLSEHPAILKEPEPWVLVDQLENATVTLRIYFWINCIDHSWLKVKSSVMRLVKRAYQEARISMPGPSGDITIQGEVPVHLTETQAPPKKEKQKVDPDPVATKAEGGLSSNVEEIKEQA